MTFGWPNHHAALDAGSALCYISGVIAPARVSAGRYAFCAKVLTANGIFTITVTNAVDSTVAQRFYTLRLQ